MIEILDTGENQPRLIDALDICYAASVGGLVGQYRAFWVLS